jgi:TPR repeat protein
MKRLIVQFIGAIALLALGFTTYAEDRDTALRNTQVFEPNDMEKLIRYLETGVAPKTDKVGDGFIARPMVPALGKEVRAKIVNDNRSFLELFKAARQGDAEAQFQLGKRSALGEGVSRDYKAAANWLKKAAEQGHAPAQQNLGVMYQNGLGVPQDDKKAVELYTKAAEQGNADAQTSLGWTYHKWHGVAQDYTKAFEWYTKAAEQGDDAAQFNLGLMYGKGNGVGQDNKKATEWWTKAAEQGHESAKEALRILKTKPAE